MNKTLFLNIGLAPSVFFGGHAITASNVYDVLTVAGFIVTTQELRQSATEETVVLTVQPPGWFRDAQDLQSIVYAVAVVLRQEAIAWRFARPVPGTPAGYLTGPHSAGWGDFDPAHFITPGPVGWTEFQS